MGYRYESKVETERKADADAFTTWLAEVANGELKAPVEGRDRVREKKPLLLLYNLNSIHC